MSELTEKCRSCGQMHRLSFDNIINVTGHPELKEKVSNGAYFTWECPHCGTSNIIGTVPCLYHDASEHLMIILSGGALKIDNVPQEYICRVVDSVGQLIEKVRIFNAGLDDATMELCKYITCQEMKKSADLKFVKMDGADGELTFTYPQNGEMQMIVVGFNVYEDCAGIIRRNQDLQTSAREERRIDRDWISKHFA